MNAIKLSTPYIRPIPSTILKALQWTQPYPSYSLRNPSILATNLIKSYFDKGSIEEARKLFDEMPERDVVAWTTMIAGYTSCNYDSLAWTIFYEMLSKEVKPNAFTVSSVLKACKGMKCYSYGCLVHGLAIKHGLVGSIYVDNSLMDVYATCCSTMDEACLVFRDVYPKTGVSWTTLIAGYTHRGDGYGGVRAFQQMLLEEAEQSAFSFSIAVKACALTGASSHGEQLHATIIKYGLNSSLPVMNSVLDMYCWCQCLSEASQCFNEMLQKDLITWNTLIAGYKRSNSSKCLSLFTSMESRGFTPNCFTFTSVVAACADLSLITCGQQIHANILQRGLDRNMALANSLIDMYAKCGSISDSRKSFELLSSKDLVSWTSMMIAYGVHGYGKEAVELYNEMIRSGIRPDRVVFMAVLSACSHAGLVNEGLSYFNSMLSEYSITPDQDIYGCVVDLLGRAGKVEAAYELIKNMPVDPNDSVWGALVGSCKAHKLPNLGKLTAQIILDARPDMGRTYLMLSNLYASEGNWREFARMRKLMKRLGGRKEPGCSWIELKNDIYSFVVGDKVGPQMERVYEVLSTMVVHMEAVAYVPDIDPCLHDPEDGT
ncbi:putative pentatricopeptide repeat-containing protein At1g56570 [Beta vulgaris subsp. vulgaris]|uniref:putative pentatricopeptide repeat-containing protein At1g56570 n=1 Tax=Beta vulgaris subsp. vulgaris TaxID=3555 RepID=UPI002037301B|nr:putative pentatricopeptide repeat-containing protein At1g56570 [Beta vulgaris subsp. vulgaris]